MSTRSLAAFLILMLPVAGASALAQNAEDLDKGKQLFLACSRCHGLDGSGGDGPSLRRPVLTRARDPQTTLAIIRDGIPDRGMPGFRQLTNAELSAVANYVLSLGRTATVIVNGNVERGEAVYQRLGCASCHTILGVGGSLGPELTNVGTHRAPDYILQAIVDPGAALPRGVQQVPGRGFNEYLAVRVITADGREIRGVRINEDSFTIQLKDATNRWFSFSKSDLRTLDKEFGKSLMPDYKGRISASELDDLVAYLASLGGAK